MESPHPAPRSIMGVLTLLPERIREHITEGDEQNILRALIAGKSPDVIAEEYRTDQRKTGYRLLK